MPRLLLVSDWKPAGALSGYTGNRQNHGPFKEPYRVLQGPKTPYVGQPPIKDKHSWCWATHIT